MAWIVKENCLKTVIISFGDASGAEMTLQL